MHAWLLLLAGSAWMAGAGIPNVGEPDPAVGPSDVGGPGARQVVVSERWARDARLSFSSRSADRARTALVSGLEQEEERAVAIMALGCSRVPADLSRLESSAVEGGRLERRAAVLAIGEMGAAGWPALERLYAGGVYELEEHAALACARVGEPAALSKLETIAGSSRGALAYSADRFLRYARGGVAPELSPAAELLLDLRWKAARRYGFVDGKSWKVYRIDQLGRDHEFLDRVIFGAALQLDRSTVRDHLIETLVTGSGTGRVRVAAAAMPEVLTRLFEAELWRPGSHAEWQALLEEVKERRNESEVRPLIEFAMESTELQTTAGLLLFRAGGDLPTAWLARELRQGSPQRRAELLEAAGDRRDPARIHDLIAFAREGHERVVRAASIVALKRLQFEQADDAIRTILEGGDSEARNELLLALARVAHDRTISVLIADLLIRTDIEPEIRFHLELAAGLRGRLIDREGLRAWLARVGPHPLRRQVVRALGQRADRADLETLRDLFPVDDDMALNVELSLALIRYRDPIVLGVLRSALWYGDWNQSILAGGLIDQASGLYGLIDELSTPPHGARQEDLRRVGFAIGQWGGLSAVEKLSQRRSEADPALQGAYLGALATRTH